MAAGRGRVGPSGLRLARFGLAACLTLCSAARAEPLDPARVPEPLRPWIEWALRGHEAERCPARNASGERLCAWPSRLSLELSARGGRFSQEWQIHEASWVPLPGDAEHWPEQVRSRSGPAAVVERGGGPSVQLAAGRHTLEGEFRWDALPEILQLPPATALLRVSLDGREIAFPRREPNGELWLRERGDAATGEAESLEVAVHRRLVDELPTLLETRIELRVAGRAREVLLGRALPEGFAPLALDAPLPARVEPDGHLRVQLRPGSWTLSLLARAEAPRERVGPPPPEGPWAPSEVWVFAARPALRLVSIEDGAQVDPGQTTLPAAWRGFPAYLLAAGQTLHLVERQRGDADPAADALSLERSFWLDFDGDGYTISDRILGMVRRSDRLELAEPALLGRASLSGEDQQITRRAGAAALGVEISRGPIELSADARIEAARGRLPAVGWDHDFQSLAGVLNLPPGWRLLHASGVDRAEQSWLLRWQLFDLFAVLVLAMGTARLFGARAGALALAALALVYTEPGAPRWLVALALGAEALRRVLPEGRLLRAARGLRLAALAALVLVSLPFAVQQLRGVLYPGLAGPPRWEEPLGFAQVDKARSEAEAREVVAREVATESTTALRGLDEVSERSQDAAIASSAPPLLMQAPPRRRYAPDPNARLSTGPGLPTWQWTRVALHWSGPVPREHELRLWLAPPWLDGLLGVLRVGLLAALLALLAGRAPRAWLPRGGRMAGLLLALGTLLAAGEARAELPSPQLLDELRARLLEPPECRPECASLTALRVEVEPQRLRLRLRVDAAAPTAVPLPGGAASWLPSEVLVNGAPAAGLARELGGALLWLQLPPGRHEISASGPLPERDSVDLPLPLRPRRVEVAAAGWSVAGVREDGQPDANLQLLRVRAAGDARAAEELEPGQLPPFARVQRELALALDWSVTTRVLREHAQEGALALEIPLLPGESVTSPEVRVERGVASVSLAPGVARLEFSSTLAIQEALALSSPTGVPWLAVWRLEAGPVWHVESSGVPPIHSETAAREWRLWPGEAVELRIARPEGAPGATLTLDRSALALAPGRRATDATLSLTFRSSLGGEHAVALPQGALLTSAAIDGRSLPLRQDADRVVLPIAPGRHEAQLGWREPRGIAGGLLFRSSRVDLGQAAVNAELSIAPPADRWLLFARGPQLGPAVLFWPLLGVFLAVSLALGRVRFSPLRARQWCLLALGLTQVPTAAAALVAAWLLALGLRRERGAALPSRSFDAAQVGLALLSLAALVTLFVSVQRGLLGLPEMQVAGNGSHAALLRWYQDRSESLLPQPWLLSVPLWVYRGLMLAWALWLAIALVGWLRYAAAAFGEGGFWRPLRSHADPAPRA